MIKLLMIILTMAFIGCEDRQVIINESLPLNRQLQEVLDLATKSLKIEEKLFLQFKTVVQKVLPKSGFFEDKEWRIEQVDSFDPDFSNFVFLCTLIEKDTDSIFHKYGIATVLVDFCKENHMSNSFMQINDSLFKDYKSQIWKKSKWSCNYAIQINYIKLKSMLKFYRNPKDNKKYFEQGQDLNRKILKGFKLSVLEQIVAI